MGDEKSTLPQGWEEREGSAGWGEAWGSPSRLPEAGNLGSGGQEVNLKVAVWGRSGPGLLKFGPETCKPVRAPDPSPSVALGGGGPGGVGAGRDREVRRTQSQLLLGTRQQMPRIVTASAFSEPTSACKGEGVAAWAASQAQM